LTLVSSLAIGMRLCFISNHHHILSAQVSIAGILQIAGLIKARKLQASEAAAEFGKLHQGLLAVSIPRRVDGVS
jgi:hypothetical protein